ncbi:unnamed protein product [Umbelopsis ramanniana]
MSTAPHSYFCHHCETPIIINRHEERPSCPHCNQQFIEELTDVPRRNSSSAALNMQQSQRSSSHSVVAIDANDFLSPLLQVILVNNDSRRRRRTPPPPSNNVGGATNTLPVIRVNTTTWFQNSSTTDRIRMDPRYEPGHNEMQQSTQNTQPQTNNSVRANTPGSRSSPQQVASSIQRPAPVHSSSPFASVSNESDRIVKISMTNTELAIMASCAICKEDYRIGERALKLPCFHVYHHDCIKPWLKSNKTCPICRRHVEYKSPSSSTRSTNAVATRA